MAEIVLFGATGFTGTLIASHLHERGLPFIIAGRDREKLQQLSERLGGVRTRVANVQQPWTLSSLVENCRLLINCVGPFLRYGEPVVNAAVDSGVHYIDITGEQVWMKRILNRYDGVALRKQVTVINGMAFEYAVGDWLAATAARRLGGNLAIDSLSVGYSLRGSGISRGTAMSLFEMSGVQGWSYEGGRWRRRPAGWTRRRMRFPSGSREVSWLPFGEVLTVPRHQRVQTVLTYMHLPLALARLLPLGSRVGPILRPLLHPAVKRYLSSHPPTPTEAQRQGSHFAITAEARRGGKVAHTIGTGRDPYGLTARIAVLAAELLLAGPTPRGVRSPAHLPIDAEEALETVGVQVER